MAHNEHIRLKKLSFFLPYDENVILFHLALTFPHDFDLSSVILEEDLEIVINGLKNEDASFAFYGHFVKEKQSLVESFTVFRFSHIKR